MKKILNNKNQLKKAMAKANGLNVEDSMAMEDSYIENKVVSKKAANKQFAKASHKKSSFNCNRNYDYDDYTDEELEIMGLL